jgi:plasmid stabilization system protein ParE
MAHRIEPRAIVDVDEVWYYIVTESGSVAIANRLIDSITSRFFLSLRQPPSLGAPPR